MRVQFNNGRHFSSTNGFIHKTVFGNSTKICKVCDQYSTKVVKNNYVYIVLTFHDGWCIVHK